MPWKEMAAMNENTSELEAWLDGAAAAIGLDIAGPYRDEVLKQLDLNRALITPMLDFVLPVDLDD